MSVQPSPTDQATQTGYYRDILHELIDMGAGLARLVHQQAQAEALPAADATVAFDRIARTVRRTILLARTLDHPAPQHAARTAARTRIIRSVEDAIHAEAGPADADDLHAELLDRLDAPDLDEEIAHRPIADVIEDICCDLGLRAMPGLTWKRRTPADIATLHARAAKPSPGSHPPVFLHPTRFRGKP